MKPGKYHLSSILSVLLAGLLGCSSAIAQQPPSTPKRQVEDVYHGVTVIDDYRWLENFADPEVKQWVAAENACTRSARQDSSPHKARS
jgi:prolyl oligopeptidase